MNEKEEKSGIGHNSGAYPETVKAELGSGDVDGPTPGEVADAMLEKHASENTGGGSVGGIAPEILRAYIERIERLEEEKKALAADIREVYAEAKGNGFEPKIMRKLVVLRRMDQADRQEEEELLDLYRRAVGI